MNLAPEIQKDWKTYQGTLPSADLLYPKWLLLQYDYSIAHLLAIISGDFL
jgi:hypothetical protein